MITDGPSPMEAANLLRAVEQQADRLALHSCE
jgi:hypothetical protein